MPPVGGNQEQVVTIAQTIGMRVLERGDGRSLLAWEAGAEYGFPTATGQVIHGGMVTTLLDSAMGAATWSVMGEDEVFLTADLRVEFHRATRPGLLRARGLVVKRTSRLVFASAELFDADDRLLAASRATQAVLPSDGALGRPDSLPVEGGDVRHN